jgi:Ca2+-binding RTX toxin-like protein
MHFSAHWLAPALPIWYWHNFEGGENNLLQFAGSDGSGFVNESANDVTYAWNEYLSAIEPVDPPGFPDLDRFHDPKAITLTDGTVVTSYWREANASNLGGVHIDISTLTNTVRVGSDNGNSPSAAQLQNGNVVVVWTDDIGSSDGHDDIRAQILTAGGVKIGGEFAVTAASNAQWTPEVAALIDGRFIVVWEDLAGDGSGSAIKAQVFTADGVRSGEVFTVNTSTAGDQRFPTVTALANGDAFVTWTDNDGATADIYSQVLDLQTYEGNDSDETVYGGSLADTLHGMGGNDTLFGRDGEDYISGGLGDDEMHGGGSNDIFVVSETGDTVHEAKAGGTDTVQTLIDFALPENVENLQGLSFFGGLELTGNELVNTISGSAFGDTISGLEGDDTLEGNSGNDTLIGGAGYDYLFGGEGSDTMQGGSGGDTYFVDSAGDVVIETNAIALPPSPFDFDYVASTVDYTLGDHVERLGLAGTADLHGTGNNLNNNIYGNSGSNHIYGLGGQDHLYGYDDADYIYGGTNTDWLYGGNGDDNLFGEDGGDVLIGGWNNDELDGGTDADYMQAGAGDDLYVVDNTGDRVVEYANQGIDLVLSSITTIAPAYTENLWLTGTANISGIGNLQDNTIIGNSGINTLSGVTGNDTLYGLGSADLLWGGQGGDVMDGGEGLDTVTYAGSQAGVYADIGSNLYFGGDANGDAVTNVENLIGSAFDDTLVGDSGGNWLNGGKGIDTLAGGNGNDTYVIDDALDVLIEVSAAGGRDTVFSSANTFTLGTNLENLRFTSQVINIGTGNDLNNVLTGNSDVDTLTGLSGDDDLIGNDGNDVLRGGLGADDLDGGPGIADLADYIGATAAVTAALDGSLTGAGEALGDTFTGLERLRGSNFEDTLRGDTLDNILFGQNGADALEGLEGLDRLFGGGGIDTLTGGAQADRFEFAALTEIGDIITDFTAVDDTIVVTASTFGGGLVAGVLNAAYFQSRADNVAQDADDRFIFQTTDQTLWFDADGNGAGAAVVVADLQAGATMTAADILVV